MARVSADIYTYKPAHVAQLRDELLRLKRRQDRQRKSRERLYKLEEEAEFSVVFEDSELIVRHIKNKSASAHYGLSTKWCISMLRESYFDSYETENATFFFFERKNSIGNEFDKTAVMISRADRGFSISAFTALDERVDILDLVEVYGSCVFDIFRDIYALSRAHPPSVVFQIHRGRATAAELESAFERIAGNVKKVGPYEAKSILLSICCNDGASWPLLEKVYARAERLLRSAWAGRRRVVRTRATIRMRTRPRRRGPSNRVLNDVKGAVRDIRAALVIHPNTPESVKQALVTALKRGRVDVGSIHHTHSTPVSVAYNTPAGEIRGGRTGRRRLRRKIRHTPKSLLRRSEMSLRASVRLREMAERLQKRLDQKERRWAEKKKRVGRNKLRRV